MRNHSHLWLTYIHYFPPMEMSSVLNYLCAYAAGGSYSEKPTFRNLVKAQCLFAFPLWKCMEMHKVLALWLK